MPNLAEAFDSYKSSPCYTCDMIASYHAAPPDTVFHFNCPPQKAAACREIHVLHLQGPPGEQGCPGNATDFDYELAHQQSVAANQSYYNKLRDAERRFEEAPC